MHVFHWFVVQAHKRTNTTQVRFWVSSRLHLQQILTRPSQARGEVTHNKTQNSNSLWINHTMRRKTPSLSQRRGKSHTHTIVHHRHTMTNSNTLIRLNHKETQAQTWVGLVSSSENRLLRKPSDQQKSYATTSVSQTQNQPNYTTGIHSTTNSPTEIDKSDTYFQHRHITHQERPSRLDHSLPPETRMDGRYDTRKHNTKYNHGSLTHRKSKIYATSNSTTNLVHQTSTSGTVNAPQTGRGKFRQEMRSPVSANNTKMRLVEKTKSHSRDGNQNRANPLFHDLISATDDTLTANQNPSTIQRINMPSTRLLHVLHETTNELAEVLDDGWVREQCHRSFKSKHARLIHQVRAHKGPKAQVSNNPYVSMSSADEISDAPGPESESAKLERESVKMRKTQKDDLMCDHCFLSLVKLKQPETSAAVVTTATSSTGGPSELSILQTYVVVSVPSGESLTSERAQGPLRALIVRLPDKGRLHVNTKHPDHVAVAKEPVNNTTDIIADSCKWEKAPTHTNSSGTCSATCLDRYPHNTTANINIVCLVIGQGNSSSHICNHPLIRALHNNDTIILLAIDTPLWMALLGCCLIITTLVLLARSRHILPPQSRPTATSE